MIVCPMCGYKFEEAEAESSCRGCPVATGCHLLKCPRCSYEVLREPRFIRAIKSWRSKRGTGGKGRRNTGDTMDKD